MHRIGQAPNPDCLHCNSTKGTTEHLLLHCPALQVHRHSSGTPSSSRGPYTTHTLRLRGGANAVAGAEAHTVFFSFLCRILIANFVCDLLMKSLKFALHGKHYSWKTKIDSEWFKHQWYEWDHLENKFSIENWIIKHFYYYKFLVKKSKRFAHLLLDTYLRATRLTLMGVRSKYCMLQT